MGDQTVALVVATYASRAAAENDCNAARSAKHDGDLDHVAGVVLEKSADGRLEIDRHDNTAKHHGWGGALLGCAIIVIAAPLGIQFLAPAVATHAGWAGVADVVGHFWYNIPKDQLRRMSNLLEADQAALVVTAVGHSGQDIASLLSNATSKIVADDTQADFETDFTKAILEAKVPG
jgi:uncharacterized membrane protein